MKAKKKIIQNGSVKYLAIPKLYCDNMDINKGDFMELEYKKDHIIIRKVK